LENSATFYLTTAGEYGPLTRPRACTAAGRFQNDARDDYMLVDIYPPFFTSTGDAQKEVSQVLLAPKWKGLSLFQPRSWPIPVYVAIIVDETVHASRTFRADQVRLVAWGTVHRSYDDAAKAAEGVKNE
jgi:hypothetical protein